MRPAVRVMETHALDSSAVQKLSYCGHECRPAHILMHCAVNCERTTYKWQLEWSGLIISKGHELWSLTQSNGLELYLYQGAFRAVYFKQLQYIFLTIKMKEILHGVKEERNILLKMKRRKAKEVCHILCRNCLIKHVIAGNIEERIEVMGRRGRRRKQLPDEFKEKRGYWKLK